MLLQNVTGHIIGNDRRNQEREISLWLHKKSDDEKVTITAYATDKKAGEA